MKRTLTATAAVLFLAVGCSSSDGNDAATTTVRATSTTVAKTTTTEGLTPGTVPVEEWAETFCEAFSTWTEGNQELGQRAEAGISAAGSPNEARRAVAATFDDALIITTVLITKIEDQDPPDMKDGKGVVDAFAGTFQEFADVIETSRAAAEAVDVDADDYSEQVKGIYAEFGNDFTAIGNSFGEIDRQYPDPEFQRALTSACDL